MFASISEFIWTLLIFVFGISSGYMIRKETEEDE